MAFATILKSKRKKKKMGEGKFTLSFIQNFLESAEIDKTPGHQLFSCSHFQERKKKNSCLSFFFFYLSSTTRNIC